jgi:putative integral membrane protein (TIGR02587 family)
MTASSRVSSSDGSSQTRLFWIGLARAFGGAIVFSLPLLMTMEMWWLGFYMDRLRLALFILLMIPLLVALDHFAGFKETASWGEDVIDGIIAYGVGIVASTVVLVMLNILQAEMPWRELIGKIALQAVPASFGAVIATSQLGGGEGGNHQTSRREATGYPTELLLMGAGAIFLAFNVAPTEEMILIAYRLTPWHALALGLASIAMMHAFVYAVEFHGAPQRPQGTPGWSIFLRFTVVGYALALLVSVYVLWTFGRYDSGSLAVHLKEAIVLGFPSALGAAAARLII